MVLFIRPVISTATQRALRAAPSACLYPMSWCRSETLLGKLRPGNTIRLNSAYASPYVSGLCGVHELMHMIQRNPAATTGRTVAFCHADYKDRTKERNCATRSGLVTLKSTHAEADARVSKGAWAAGPHRLPRGYARCGSTRNLLLDNGALQEYATHHVRGTWRLQRPGENSEPLTAELQDAWARCAMIV